MFLHREAWGKPMRVKGKDDGPKRSEGHDNAVRRECPRPVL